MEIRPLWPVCSFGFIAGRGGVDTVDLSQLVRSGPAREDAHVNIALRGEQHGVPVLSRPVRVQCHGRSVLGRAVVKDQAMSRIKFHHGNLRAGVVAFRLTPNPIQGTSWSPEPEQARGAVLPIGVGDGERVERIVRAINPGTQCETISLDVEVPGDIRSRAGCDRVRGRTNAGPLIVDGGHGAGGIAGEGERAGARVRGTGAEG